MKSKNCVNGRSGNSPRLIHSSSQWGSSVLRYCSNKTLTSPQFIFSENIRKRSAGFLWATFFCHLNFSLVTGEKRTGLNLLFFKTQINTELCASFLVEMNEGLDKVRKNRVGERHKNVIIEIKNRK